MVVLKPLVGNLWVSVVKLHSFCAHHMKVLHLLAAKRCAEVMDTPSNLGDDQISSPTEDDTVIDNIRPGGSPYESTDDSETIEIVFKNDQYDSAEVTEVTISRNNEKPTNVEQVTIYYKPAGSDSYEPYVPPSAGVTGSSVISVTDDVPIVLTGLENTPLEAIKIVVEKVPGTEKVSFDVKVHACLEPGENALCITFPATC